MVVLGPGADVEVGAERPGDLLGEELADGGAAGDPADDLADEVALGEGVVAGRGAGLPQRRLRGEERGRLLPVVEVGLLDRLLPSPDSPAVWAMRWRTSMASLPLAANSGQ